MCVCEALEGLVGGGEARVGVPHGEVGGGALMEGRRGVERRRGCGYGFYSPRGVRGCEREELVAQDGSGEH